MGYVVVLFDAGGWHAVGVYPDWPAALIAHGAAINALRVVDHPHAEEVKIIPEGEGYAHPPLSKAEPTGRVACRAAGCANAAMPGQDYCARHLMTF